MSRVLEKSANPRDLGSLSYLPPLIDSCLPVPPPRLLMAKPADAAATPLERIPCAARLRPVFMSIEQFGQTVVPIGNSVPHDGQRYPCCVVAASGSDARRALAFFSSAARA